MNEKYGIILLGVLVVLSVAHCFILFGMVAYEKGYSNGAYAYGYNGSPINFYWNSYPPMTVGATSQFISTDYPDSSHLIIKELYPIYGVDNNKKEYLIIYSGDNVNTQNPPEGFPLRTKVLNSRLIIYVPFEEVK